MPLHNRSGIIMPVILSLSKCYRYDYTNYYKSVCIWYVCFAPPETAGFVFLLGEHL